MFHKVEQRQPAESGDSHVRSLSRGLQLLEILSEAPHGLALSSIAQQANLSKSSTHRLLQTLLANGYVSQRQASGHYYPSLKLLTLSSNLMQETDLRAPARPHLEQLALTTGETVHLVLLDQDQAVYVEKVESSNPIRMVSRVGMRVPLHCTGVGKAILAFLPEERIEALLRQEVLQSYTPSTITDPQTLRSRLRSIRERGFAIDDGEHEEHVRCLAAPLFTRDRQVAGAVSIAAVSYRVDLETLEGWWPSLREHASQLNTELAHYFDRYI